MEKYMEALQKKKIKLFEILRECVDVEIQSIIKKWMIIRQNS